MKILVIDDESKKIKKIYKVLREIKNKNFNVENSVEYILNLPDAKKSLANELYDFLILDLNMPKLIGEDSDENAGLELIEDILEIDRYNIPNEIIILTEYDNLMDKIKSKYYSDMLTILKYDDQSQTWESKIKAKIEFGLLKESKVAKADIVIMTAVQNEYDAVKKVFAGWEEVKEKGDLTHYSYTTIITVHQKKNLKIVLVKQDEMGMTAAATLTSKIILKFNPDYIIMCGIAACLNSEHNYGDIIIPYEVWNYSSGKIVNAGDGKKYILQQDPKYIQIDSKLKSNIDNDYGTILYKIKKEWNQTISHDLNIIHGPMACGTSVVADEEYINENILKHARKTVGLDMESYGMFYACKFFNMKTKALCIKSVSDFANKDKGDDYQKYASYTSACFAKYLIEEILPVKNENT